MEYVEGKTLEQVIRAQKSGPLRVAQATRLIARVAAGIEHAASPAAFHRDLKPANILLDLHGRPRITDFGLALGRFELREHQGERAGRPAYMSPEQWREEVHDLDDGKADVWAVGVILYELLTGGRPFSQKNHDLKQRIPSGSTRRASVQLNPLVDPPIWRSCACVFWTNARSAGRPTAGELAQWIAKPR